MTAALLALALAAQPSAGLEQRRATIVQFEIKLAAGLSPAEEAAATEVFAADTRTIRRCADAGTIGARYKAEKRFSGSITERRNTAFAAIPIELRRELDKVPTGHATRVFGSAGVRRVLIACTVPTVPADRRGTI
ncbi:MULTISPECIES: hypothetical protein [Sphingomonas]|jgi:hypothetical protein|uniref:Uncharacterized protein n=1 Tax=Sphingomonas hankookensis TaxID=563996 RepID=A0ABR5Y7R8_9SPHN|nr:MULTISPECIES: hypothetical protein [Sphingomonas]KZE08593.1 hypothetical protein AVT10_08545 [Sphingomonas hankookensis]PZT92739.1 MAG: hypothetical protein DI625_11530 [Sphingomonas sp.]RSV24362.1 hypothetical protein CA237_13370 [Sphingomonas sp. ABOLH]WCP71350.1 hypothetical protein PPZ50_13455 [Sphingomonas hankookensis]